MNKSIDYKHTSKSITLLMVRLADLFEPFWNTWQPKAMTMKTSYTCFATSYTQSVLPKKKLYMYYNRKEYHMTSSYPQSTCIPFTTQGFQHFINGKPQKNWLTIVSQFYFFLHFQCYSCLRRLRFATYKP